MMTSTFPVQLDDRFIAGSRRLSRFLSYSVMLVGVLVLAGWTLDIERFKSIYGEISMKANAALGFLLAGISLWALNRREQSPRLHLIGGICAGIAALIGFLTLSQHVFGWNLGIDQLFFTEPPGERATTSPGRMGPNASTSFTLSGLALILFHSRRAFPVAQTLSALVTLLSLLAIIGYAYQVETLYGIARYTGIALHTALTFFALGLSLLTARPDQGIVSVVSSDRAGGVMARRLLIAAILTPFFMGWLRVLAGRGGYFGPDFGTSLLVVVLIVVFTLVVWRSAAELNYLDQLQLAAEQEREQLYVREKQARAEAESASRLKDEFLATVSHELRTPLNAILGWGAMLNRERLDEETVSRAMQAIERNAKAQAQLIEDLLDVSRIISGKLRLDVKPLQLTSVISAAIDSVRPAAEAKGIQMNVTMDPAASFLTGDATRLQQVLWNLLSNAVKFTPRGGLVRLELKGDDSNARVTVSDTGQGIGPEFLPYVFDRFQQADGSITRSHGGLGLGLAISRHLVEMHGGTIEAHSEGHGQGATFTLTLPAIAVLSRPYPENTPLLKKGPNGSAAPNLRGLKILSVDDEPDVREMLKAVLEHYGAEVTATASVEEALQALQKGKPDVLVCDIGMPEEDGYSLIRKIRALVPEQGGNIPAVVLTGYVRVEERVRALAAGFQMFVPKPIEADELASIIASLMGRTDKSEGAWS